MRDLFMKVVTKILKGEDYVERLTTNINAIQAYVFALPDQERKHLQPWIDDSKKILKEMSIWIEAIKRR